MVEQVFPAGSSLTTGGLSCEHRRLLDLHEVTVAQCRHLPRRIDLDERGLASLSLGEIVLDFHQTSIHLIVVRVHRIDRPRQILNAVSKRSIFRSEMFRGARNPPRGRSIIPTFSGISMKRDIPGSSVWNMAIPFRGRKGKRPLSRPMPRWMNSKRRRESGCR